MLALVVEIMMGIIHSIGWLTDTIHLIVMPLLFMHFRKPVKPVLNMAKAGD